MEHIKDYKNVIKYSNVNDALVIKATQDVIQNEFLIQNLMFIKTYYRTIADNTKKLETTGIPLTESIKVVANCAENFRIIPGTCRVNMVTKYDTLSAKNFDFLIISTINEILRG